MFINKKYIAAAHNINKNKRLSYLLALLVIGLYLSAYAKHPFHNFLSFQQSNTAPVVTIINPKKETVITAPSQIAYSISVKDKEDGDSKYDEINTKEVLLQVSHVDDAAKLSALLSAPVAPDAPGLAITRSSNCFNCHNFTTKLIGPSFHDIAKKYGTAAASMAQLQKSILQGSTGVWGNVSMPSHPELTKDEAKDIVQWILDASASPGTDYYVGTNGTFSVDKKGIYVLTASYTDHGKENSPGQKIRGTDRLVISSK